MAVFAVITVGAVDALPVIDADVGGVRKLSLVVVSFSYAAGGSRMSLAQRWLRTCQCRVTVAFPDNASVIASISADWVALNMPINTMRVSEGIEAKVGMLARVIRPEDILRVSRFGWPAK